MNSPLTADELGDKGEKRFGELCADAKLICNQSDRDRTGWDYLVETPFPKFEDQPNLDSRPKPLSCHVQVKTVWETGTSIRVRLSSAEHLAKEPKPTFIYVLKVDHQKQVVAAYLIHIFDDVLAAILKRLRRECSKGNSTFNRNFIEFKLLKVGKPLPVTGEAFRSAIEGACAPDMQTYISRKEEQRKVLGFEGPAFQIQATLRANSMSDIVDAFLGLNPEVEAIHTETHETRFGIKLPLHESGKDGISKFTITPNPAGESLIKISSTDVPQPTVFRGVFYVPALPGLPSNELKLRISTPELDMIITRTGLSFEMASNNKAQTLDSLLRISRGFSVIGERKGKIKIELGKQAPFELNLENIELGNFDPNALELARWRCDLLERTIFLFGLAGLPPDTSFSIQDIEKNARVIWLGFDIFQNKEIPNLLKFSLEEKMLRVVNDLNVMMHATIPTAVGNIAYAFITRCTPSGDKDGLAWSSQEIKPLEIDLFQNGNERIWLKKLEEKVAPAAIFAFSDLDPLHHPPKLERGDDAPTYS